MERLLLATSNPGKRAEFQELLGDIPYQLTGLLDEGIDFEVAESGTSYEENARRKAEQYAQASGLLTLADDSGLEVDALGGQPGHLSARYGGPGLPDAERVELLLRNLAEVPQEKRTARFVCVIAIAHPEKPTRTVRGECYGIITEQPRGANGFGYDPVFLFPPLGKTLAEVTSQEKHAVSHRGNAVGAARALLLKIAAQTSIR